MDECENIFKKIIIKNRIYLQKQKAVVTKMYILKRKFKIKE